MNVVVMTDIDIAGQLSYLWRGLNRFTPFKTRYICLQKTYLDYPTDIVPMQGMEQEISDAIDTAEFFIFGRTIYDLPFHPFGDRLNRNNHLVVCYGSETRLMPEKYLYKYLRDDLMIVTSIDYTSSSRVGFSAQHMPIMYNPEDIPEKKPPNDGKIRISHTPTNRQIKQTDLFLKAAEELKKEYPIETVLIEGKPWKECLQLKRQAEINYEQMAIGSYGMAAVESWAMEQAVIGRLNNWVRSIHPDAPIIDATPETLKARLESLLKREDFLREAQVKGKKFAKEVHDWRKVIRQWEHLIKFTMER
jgi:hypothetical protein